MWAPAGPDRRRLPSIEHPAPVDMFDDGYLRQRLDLLHERRDHRLPALVRHQRRLLHDIERPRRERVETGALAFLVEVRAEEQHRRRVVRHDAFGGLHAAHARHDQIHRHQIGFELGRELDRLTAVGRHAHNPDAWIGFQHLLENFADDHGIVDDQDADFRPEGRRVLNHEWSGRRCAVTGDQPRSTRRPGRSTVAPCRAVESDRIHA